MSVSPTDYKYNLEPMLPINEHSMFEDPLSAELFSTMRESVFSGLGAQFWGIRINALGKITSHRPNNMQYRWADLVLLLQKIPELEDKSAKSLSLNYYDAIKHAERNMSTEVNDSLDPNSKRLGLTYREAFRLPGIRYPAFKALQEIGDPFVGTISVLEEWRLGNFETVSDQQAELGRETFEKFLFANGEYRLIPSLGAAATGYLKNST